jgi:MFS family permease
VWLILIATTAVQTIAALAQLALPSIAPLVAQALEVETALIGPQVSLAYAGAMITALIGGNLVRRFGATRTSQTGLILSGIGAALATLPSLYTLFAASLMLGFGYGMTNPAASHLLVRYTDPKRRGLVFSLKQTGVPLGGMLAGLSVPPLAATFGWQVGLLAVAGVSFLLALALQPVRKVWDADREPNWRAKTSPFSGLLYVFRHKPLLYLSLAAFCYAAVQLSLTTFMVAFLVHDLKIGAVEAGIALALSQATGAVGRLFWGWLADRARDNMRVLTILGGLTIVAALTAGLANSGWSLGLIEMVFCLFALAAVGWNGIYLAEVARLSPGEVGQATGASLFFTYGGVLFGPSLFALLHVGLDSYAYAYAFTAVPTVLGIFCLIAARKSFETEGRGGL